MSSLAGAALLPGRIEQRLIDAEVSEGALFLWASLVGELDSGS
jgi:hypothetical protein